ncbi:MAG TPA: hypothetical protein VHN79_12280 [Lacunisphaera sp.]|nr:hypothetical protein [Lacunisphaera sp.]
MKNIPSLTSRRSWRVSLRVLQPALLLALSGVGGGVLRAEPLHGERLLVAIDDATGALQRITDLRDQRVLAGASHDAYVLRLSRDTKVEASETGDRVISRQRGRVRIETSGTSPIATSSPARRCAVCETVGLTPRSLVA